MLYFHPYLEYNLTIMFEIHRLKQTRYVIICFLFCGMVHLAILSTSMHPTQEYVLADGWDEMEKRKLMKLSQDNF